MEPPALKLVMIEGPRKGETLVFQPRSTIRIGRVVRGNNLTIKDFGISSKHLLIGCESGKWTVQDLDSSNGTALNSSPLPPFTLFDLHDGDTVKLGEVTSIVVHFDDLPSQVRRNPRRNAASGSVAKGRIEIEENVEILEESAHVEEKPRRGRPRRGKVLDRVPEVEKNVGAVAEKREVTESRKDNNCLISDKELETMGSVVDKPEMEIVNVRVTRNRKNKKPSISENLGGEGGVAKQLGRGRRKNLQGLPPQNVQVGVTEKERVDEQVNEGEQEKVNEVEVTEDQTVVGEEKKDGLDAEKKGEDTGTGPGLKESGEKAQVNDDENVGLGKEQVNQNENENVELGQETFDFEKGTIGQWLDFMEVHLPKQITQATEEMIDGMRRKAERVAEYMVEQKKAKGLLKKS